MLVAMQLTSFTVLPMTLKAAIELGVLEIIAQAGEKKQMLTAAQVADKIPSLNNPNAPAVLDRILRLLASYSVLSSSVEVDDTDGSDLRRYGPAPVLKYLTCNHDGASMAGMGLLTQDKVFMDSWYHLKVAVLNGEVPFVKAHGVTAYEYTGKDPSLKKTFNLAMWNQSTIIMGKLIERYTGFKDNKVLVDVGGGIGTNLSMLVSKYPHIKGKNFDLPHVISEAPTFPGVEHIGGDMLTSIPCGDTILLKWILHNWDDEDCITILKNCWKALPENGEVIIVEHILPVDAQPTLATKYMFHMDLMMLAFYHGGKERTEKEYRSLAKQAGFSFFSAFMNYAGFWLMKIVKNSQD